MHPQIEKAFRTVSKTLFGKELTNLQSYEKWLFENVRMPTEHKSAVSDKIVYLPFFSFFQATREKVVKLEEGEEIGKKKISSEDAERLSIENAGKLLADIKLYAPEAMVGKNIAVEKSSRYGFSSYCYYGETFVNSKYCAYCMWPRQSEYAFGCDYLFSSKFCIKCYRSENITRCFEVSHSIDCSDCYFCHNCENLQECMFCFNAKSLRYAVGNVEIGKEEYMKVKKRVLASIYEKIEKEKRLGYSIFTLGLSCLK